MADNEELEARLEQLQAQIDALNLDRRRLVLRQRWSLAVGVLLAAFVVAATQVRSANSPSVVTCRELNVVDNDGHTVISLASNNQGGIVDLLSPKGDVRLRADVGDIGQGELLTSGKTGNRLMALSGDDDGGYLRVCGADGQGRLLLACQTNAPNAGLINLKDGAGHERVNIGSDIYGGEITAGIDGNTVTDRIGSDKHGGYYYIYGTDHKAHIVMANGEGNVGLINTRDGNGFNRIILGYDDQGGQVIVNGLDSKPRAGLFVGNDGAGIVTVYDKNGNIPASASP